MTEKCADRDCRDGLYTEIHKKAPKSTIITMITVFITLLGVCVGGPLLYSMAAEKKQNDKIAEIPVIQKDIEHIKGNIKTINSAVEDIRKEMRKQINKDDLNRLIEAVRNGK